MQRVASISIVILASFACAASIASAQRRVQYDTLSESTPAAVSCGFCAGEKFGMVFRPLDGGGGLRADEFPLTLQSIEVAVARTQVTGDLTGYTCMGSSDEGTIPMIVEAYAGETAPRGSISSFPASGPWAGETALFGESAELTLSIETTPGSRMYNVMVTSVPVMVPVAAPNTYIRVVVTIPGGGSSTSCTDFGLTAPGAVGIRDDDGRIENNVGFIYAVEALGGAVPAGWHWNESSDIADPATGATGINGEWAIRLDVAPVGMPMTDAGTAMLDAGTPDAALPTGDSGPIATTDGGATTCSADRDCGGGERCMDGTCTPVSCATAADCLGGMTCVDAMCRALCSADSECRGGEVCDRALGYCAPVSTASPGGCSCRAAGAGESA
ncbi:MAG: hypothetical protein M3Y87_04225, partial [Myxococcota bacterium]|nr:hypothetical protein [Myxococcota bacterium]